MLPLRASTARTSVGNSVAAGSVSTDPIFDGARHPREATRLGNRVFALHLSSSEYYDYRRLSLLVRFWAQPWPPS